jgi:hypothetical protein
MIFTHTGEIFPSKFIHNSPVVKVSIVMFSLVYCKCLHSAYRITVGVHNTKVTHKQLTFYAITKILFG